MSSTYLQRGVSMSRGIEFAAYTRVVLLTLLFGMFGRSLTAKTIQATPGVPVIAETTWYYVNCTTSAGLGSYSINVAPTHGTVGIADVSGPLPGCPTGSPSLPAVQATYTWTDLTTSATTDFFELYYILNGLVAAVLDVNVTLSCPSSTDQVQAQLLDQKKMPGGRSIATRTGTSRQDISNLTTSSNDVCTSPPPPPPPPPPVVITTTVLPDAVSGDPYSQGLTATGGQGTITWSISSGSLPAGFSLSSDGTITTNGQPPAEPDHYAFIVNATDGNTTASQPLTLAVAPADCTKLFIVNSPQFTVLPVQSIYVEQQGTDTPEDPDFLGFYTGASYDFYGFQIPTYDGIQILVGPGVKLNPATPKPAGQVSLAFIQNLTSWPADGSGATYTHGPGTLTRTERIPALAGGALAPLLDAPSNDPSNPYYAAASIDQPTPVLRDSPQTHAPIRDLLELPLTHVTYVKRFSAYLGCYNYYDSLYYPTTNPLHYFHPMAVVNWHANYSGTVKLRRESLDHYEFEDFIPDNPTDTGIHVDGMRGTTSQPVIVAPVANGTTQYTCLTGTTPSDRLCP